MSVIKHRCALDTVCTLNDLLLDIQNKAIRGTVWSPVLEYKTFAMDRHMGQALI